MKRRRRGELEYGDELPILIGDIGAIHHPFNPTNEEAEQWAADLREKERRRRPCGFAPWPDACVCAEINTRHCPVHGG